MARSPLFEIYDPSGLLQQRASMGLLDSDDDDYDPLIPPRRRPQLSDLMPEEEKQGMLRALAGATTTGLSTAGWLLDTPGAMVRGLLSGGPGKAASALWESADDRVDGRELLRQYGMVGKDDNWLNWAGSLAAETVLDPLFYMNPLAALGKGSLTRAVGVPLKKAGLLRDAALDAQRGFTASAAATADDVVGIAGDTVPRIGGAVLPDRAPSGVREYLRNLTPERAFAEARAKLTPEEYDEALKRFEAAGGRMDDTRGAAGLMSFKVPGTDIQYDITGGAFGDAIASGLDRLGEASKSAPIIGPVSRAAAAALDADAGYTLDPNMQWSHRFARRAAERNESRFREAMTGLQRAAMEAEVPEFVDINGVRTAVPEQFRSFSRPEMQNAFADWLESGGARASDNALSVPGSGVAGRTSGDSVADWVMENVPEFKRFRDAMDQLGPSALQAAQERALKLPTWTSRLSDTRFFPSQMLWLDNPKYVAGQIPKQESAYSRGDRLFGNVDNFGRSRNMYTDLENRRRTFRILTGGPKARELQDALLNANDQQAPGIIDRFFQEQGLPLPYQKIVDAAKEAGGDTLVNAQRQADQLKVQLANLLRSVDRQYAEKGIGIFDTPVFSDALRYGSGQARVSAYADELINQLRKNAVDAQADLSPGGTHIPLSQAAEQLSFDPEQFTKLFNQTAGKDITNYSIDRRVVESMKALAPVTQLGLPESKIANTLGSFTNLWKIGALAWPSFHTRNAFSNALAAAAGGGLGVGSVAAGARAAKGDLSGVAALLRNAPVYRDLPDDAARMQKFAKDSARASITGGSVLDDFAASPEQAFAGLYPGASQDNNIGKAVGDLLFGGGKRSWKDWLTFRGVGVDRPTSATRNPLLRVNDAIGATVEDTSRLSMFAELLRKGYSPDEAGDMVRRALVDYRPSAFTPFERQWAKTLLPFYSFQKGVIPGIADHLLYRPGGMMGQSIRGVTRASTPSEENFLPENLRHSAAIPLPAALGGEPAENLRRYVTNIDMPWESTFQLLTPGTGPTLGSRIGDTLAKTGSNLLGMTNPLIKAPIEYATNRQLFSGRNLSDLYSTLENSGVPMGRELEQVIQNFVPFGSRALGLYRTLSDKRLDQRDAAIKALFNNVAGLKVTDVDQERSRRLAAREVLNSMLEATPGVRTYENVTVPEDVLRTMPEEQRRQYLLYKIIQSEAAKRAREKKQAALDPLQVLGVIQ